MIELLQQRILASTRWFLAATAIATLAGLMHWPGATDGGLGGSSVWRTPATGGTDVQDFAAILAGWHGTVDPEQGSADGPGQVENPNAEIEGLSLVGIVEVDGELVAHLVGTEQGIFTVRIRDELENGAVVVDITSNTVVIEYDSGAKMLELTLYPVYHG